MKLQQPVAARQFALLALAVLAVHLLVVGQLPVQEAPHPHGARVLVTRVLATAQPEARTQAPLARPRPQRNPVAARLQDERPAVHPATQEAEAASSGLAVAATEPSARAAVAAPSSDPVAATAPSIELPGAPPAVAPMAFAIPGSVRLRYGVTGLSRGQLWNLTGQLLWRHDGSQYEAKLEYASPLLPSRSQQSTGSVTAQGLAPLRFSDKSRGEQATHFERDRGTLIFSSNAPQLPLPAGAQDRLSVFLQLAAMLAADPSRYPAGTGITVVTVGTRDAEPWLFTVEGDETLILPGGTVPTRKLVRNPRRDYDLRIELWLGIGMDYVPVRIRLTQANGDYVDQQWSSTDRS